MENFQEMLFGVSSSLKLREGSPKHTKINKLKISLNVRFYKWEIAPSLTMMPRLLTNAIAASVLNIKIEIVGSVDLMISFQLCFSFVLKMSITPYKV